MALPTFLSCYSFICILSGEDEVDEPDVTGVAVVICAAIIIALFLVAVLSVVIFLFIRLEKKSKSEVYTPDKRTYFTASITKNKQTQSIQLQDLFLITFFIFLCVCVYREIRKHEMEVDKSLLDFGLGDDLAKVDVSYEDEFTVTNKIFRYASCSVKIPGDITKKSYCAIRSIPQKFVLNKVNTL